MLKKIALILILICLFFPTKAFAQEKTEYINAKVIGISEDSLIIESNGFKHPYQKLQVEAKSGSKKGKVFTIENGNFNQSDITKYSVGDSVVLTITGNPQGERIQITDYSRTTPLLFIAVVFVVLAIIIGGKRGARSLLGMGITFLIIFTFIIPQVTHGQNPILITAVAILIVIPLTFLLSHGINTKTVAAIISTYIVLGFIGVCSQFALNASHLTGYASEETSYLNFLKNGSLDMKGLLFSGIIIALLGVLQDITISQAAIVIQLQKANSKLSKLELFKRSMDVGRDHIASMTNTLILVYAGASLPLLLLFTSSNLPLGQIFNFEIVAEEIVRTLMASIGLILAVPITTALTVLISKKPSTKINPA